MIDDIIHVIEETADTVALACVVAFGGLVVYLLLASTAA